MYKFIIFAGLLTAGCMPSVPTVESRNLVVEMFKPIDVYAESLAYDPAAAIFYVSSARSGAIGKVDLAGNYSVFYNNDSLVSTYGLNIDPSHHFLYACVGDDNSSERSTEATRFKLAKVIRIDLATAEKKGEYDLSALVNGHRFPKDLCFDTSGNVYITDNAAGVIYKLPVNGEPFVFSRSRLFQAAGGGLSGIAYDSSGFLLADNNTTGDLYAINTHDSSNVRRVNAGMLFPGAGHLLLEKNELTLLLNGKVNKAYKLVSKDNWITAKVIAGTSLENNEDYPSAVASSSSNIWLVDTKSDNITATGFTPHHFALRQVALGEKINKE